MEDDDQKGQDQKRQEDAPAEPEPPASPVQPPPYQEVPVEDIVSHVESLHNCNDPVFHTVCVYVHIMHYLRVFNSNWRENV